LPPREAPPRPDARAHERGGGPARRPADPGPPPVALDGRPARGRARRGLPARRRAGPVPPGRPPRRAAAPDRAVVGLPAGRLLLRGPRKKEPQRTEDRGQRRGALRAWGFLSPVLCPLWLYFRGRRGPEGAAAV